MKNWLLYFVVHYRTLDRERARAIQQCKRHEQSGRSLTVCLLFKKKVKIQATLHVIFPTIHFLFPDDDGYDIYGKQFVELALNSVQVSLNNRLATFQAPVSTYTVIIFQTDLHTLTWGSGWENLLKGQSQKKCCLCERFEPSCHFTRRSIMIVRVNVVDLELDCCCWQWYNSLWLWRWLTTTQVVETSVTVNNNSPI